MPREEIGEGVRVGDRCANTGENAWEWMGANGVPIIRMTNKLSVRRWMTLDEAERGDIPKSFSKEEWAAMACAARAPVAL